MSKRNIVRIDEEKCNGCGLCVTACAEGAIQIVDGKARLVSEVYCDGLGACLGECPQGAITIEVREAEEFDEAAVKEHLARVNQSHTRKDAGTEPVAPRPTLAAAGGCPGSALRNLFQNKPPQKAAPSQAPGASCLGNWPVQLKLVPPMAPFLKGADLLVCADCVPFAVPDFHERYLNGRVVLVGCPKLDDIEFYREKLRSILRVANPASLTVLRMEVPCCAGIALAALDAMESTVPDLPTEIHIIGIEGGITRQVIAGKEAKQVPF